MAWALTGELTNTVYALWQKLAATAFASVPQRVARHLLEIAARALRELRDEGVVRVSRSSIHVLDPALLAARAWPSDLGH